MGFHRLTNFVFDISYFFMSQLVPRTNSVTYSLTAEVIAGANNSLPLLFLPKLKQLESILFYLNLIMNAYDWENLYNVQL